MEGDIRRYWLGKETRKLYVVEKIKKEPQNKMKLSQAFPEGSKKAFSDYSFFFQILIDIEW